MPKTARPYGEWPSPITPELLTASGVSCAQPCIVGSTIYWTERRPEEAGRIALVRLRAGAPLQDATPETVSLGTRIHEYGGGDYVATEDGTIFYCDGDDQRLYRLDPTGTTPVPLTPEPNEVAGLRYAEPQLTSDGAHLICVREAHPSEHASLDLPPSSEAITQLILVATDGTEPPIVLASGHDFFSFPRLSPDGRYLAWTTWDHPQMPWDGTELWIAEFGSNHRLSKPRRVAGDPSESIFQPEWAPDGHLYFSSDRTDWWNLYRVSIAPDRTGEIEPVFPIEAEFASPQWLFGLSRYTFLQNGRIAAFFNQNGADHLALIDPEERTMERIDMIYTSAGNAGCIHGNGVDDLVFTAGAADRAFAVVRAHFPDKDPKHVTVETVHEGSPLAIGAEYLSRPEPIEFPSENGRTAYALYYPPRHPDFAGTEGELPPLLVLSHGGPTTATTSNLSLGIQFWTTRGFAVVDVNYGGSSGYGRRYRDLLKLEWGIVDREDCAAAAVHLESAGKVDRKRMAIRGGSAGGFTTLCALTFTDVFAAGASFYGVGDLELLATDTHKFESRYLDSMVGPYPEQKQRYRDRSPVHHLDRLSCPVILFQGLLDRVVPPSQAETMVAALAEIGIPHAYVTYAEERHGFKNAKNIRHMFESELAFYGRVFGFDPDGELASVEIIGG